ncbi:chorismate synthase, partial [Aureobasidium melanogenum]
MTSTPRSSSFLFVPLAAAAERAPPAPCRTMANRSQDTKIGQKTRQLRAKRATKKALAPRFAGRVTAARMSISSDDGIAAREAPERTKKVDRGAENTRVWRHDTVDSNCDCVAGHQHFFYILSTPYTTFLQQIALRRSDLVLRLDVDGLLLFSGCLVGTLSGLHRDDGVHDDESSHGLDNGNGTGNDTGVVTTLGLENTLGFVVGSGGLRLANSSSWLEANSEVNVGTVGNTALDTTRVVGLCGKTRASNTGFGGTRSSGRTLGGRGNNEGVVVNATRDSCTAETRTNLEALCGRDAQHGVGQLCLHLVEAGLTQTRGHITDNASDITTDAVFLLLVLCDQIGHAVVGLLIRAADGQELVHLLAGDFIDQLEEFGVGRGGWVVCCGRVELLVADRRGESDDLDTVGEPEVLLGNGSGSNAACTMSVGESMSRNRYGLTNGLASTASTTSTAGLDAVLLQSLGLWFSFMTRMPMGVPRVTPNSVPDWISTLSFSLRGVVMALCPGRHDVCCCIKDWR